MKKNDLAEKNEEKNVLVKGPVRSKEIISLLLTCILIYLLMAMASFSLQDSAWNYLTDHPVHNIAGPVGAWIADILLTLFGYMAWFFIIVLASILVGLLRYRKHPFTWKYSMIYLQLPAFIVMLLAGSALFSHFVVFTQQEMPVSSGGIAGELILELFFPYFGTSGSLVLLIAIFILGSTLLTGFSWLVFGELVLRVLHGCTQTIIKKLYRAFSWFFSILKTGITYKKFSLRSRNRQQSSVLHTAEQTPSLSLTRFNDQQEDRQSTNEKKLPAREPEGFPAHPIDTASLSTTLLDRPKRQEVYETSMLRQQERANLLEEKLKDFGVEAKVVDIQPGPVVTRFEIQPAPGTKVNKISGLSTDLARSLSVIRVRVVEVIPGKSVVGIEVPNATRKMVYLSEVVESSLFSSATSPLSLALGQNIGGDAFVANLEKMPHLLVAGTTGSGKSVGVNAMILSLLYKASPADVRMIMIDPKMLELSVYEGIPHLLTPVVTDMKEAAGALRWCVIEMERRYKLMAAMGVRNITGCNERIKSWKKNKNPIHSSSLSDEQLPQEPLPFIVVIIDEFADMMMIVGKKVEELIARIAQKARAAGIHLILATQRPSVDVITGLIKANVPARISFQVSSKIDSRTIIDQSGAEQLLGHGDMLYLPPGSGIPLRIHGAFVSDEEVHRVVADWKSRGTPEYVEDILQGGESASDNGSALSGGLDDSEGEQDSLYDQAVAFVLNTGKVSVSSVQRQFKIGYNRAANIVEAMEQAGIISKPGHNGAREILVPKNSG